MDFFDHNRTSSVTIFETFQKCQFFKQRKCSRDQDEILENIKRLVCGGSKPQGDVWD